MTSPLTPLLRGEGNKEKTMANGILSYTNQVRLRELMLRLI
ncbi:MAG: hypothetical protein RIB93_07890 [Coleofasciculus sp. D1-CHI-01]